MKRIVIPVLAIFISSCGAPPLTTPAATLEPVEVMPPTVTPVCVSPEPSEDDIDRAVSFGGDILDVDEWEKTYSVSPGSVSVTWQNIPQSAVIFLEAIIFPCSYEEPDLNDHFNDENWDAIFANYEVYEMIEECRSDDGLRLYQFEASSQGLDYDIDYWVLNDTETRVITAMLVFPVGSESILDDYSSRLFPDLTTCL